MRTTQFPPELLSQFLANRLKSAMSSSPALRNIGDFQLVLAVRDERGDLDYGVVDVRGGAVTSKGAEGIDTRAPYASLQLDCTQVSAMIAGKTIEPELAYETAPLLSVIAKALSGSSGVSPWQTRL